MPAKLKIENLSAHVKDQPILHNISLTFQEGETHAIMGRNGSGKSSLGKIIAGHPDYTVVQGQILWEEDGKTIDFLSLPPEERSTLGVFLAPQYPTEIPGLSLRSFLKTAFNAHRRERNEPELDTYDFSHLLEEKARELQYNPQFLDRSMNVGFSGGEKKRNEILQMALLSPRFAFLDEIDSGLDVDALALVLSQVKSLHHAKNAQIFITHYAHVIEQIKPSWVHILGEGHLLLSTQDTSLTQKIQKEGFDFLLSGRDQ